MNQILLLLATLILFSSIARTQWLYQDKKAITTVYEGQTYIQLCSIDLGSLDASIVDLEESRMFRETAICHVTGNPRHRNPHPYPWMHTITADSLIQDSTYHYKRPVWKYYEDNDYMQDLSLDPNVICDMIMIRKEETYL